MRVYGALIYKPGIGWVRAANEPADTETTIDPRKRDWREEGFEWMRPDTPAGRIFDVLSRSNYGMANWGLEQVKQAQGEAPEWLSPEDQQKFAKIPAPIRWHARSQIGALRGLFGKDKVFWEDVLNEADATRKWPTGVKTALGLGGDVLLDPLTYLSGGVTKAGRGAKVASTARKMGQLTDTGIDLAGKAGKSLKLATKQGKRIQKAMKITGKSADELAGLWNLGKVGQSEAGLRGVLNFFGQPIAAGTGYQKWAERLPAWLAGGEAGLGALGQKSGKVYSALDENVPGLRKLLKEVGEKFTPGDTLFKPLRETALGSRRLGQVTDARFGEAIEPWAKAWRGFAGTGDEGTTLTRTLLETYELGPEAGRRLGLVHDAAKLGKIDEFASSARKLFGKMEDVERVAFGKQGIDMMLLGKTNQLDLFGKPELQHLTMFFDRDALVKLNKTPQGKRLVHMLMSMQDPGQQQRMFQGMTHLDVNTVGRRNLGELFGSAFDGMKVDNLLIEDPIQIMALRGERVGRVVAGSEFLEGAKSFLVPATDEALRAGLVPVDIAAKVGKKTHKVLDGLVGEPFIANEIARIWHITQDVESMNQLLRVYDNVLNTWRGYALMAPSYHIRNAFSNVWQNFIGGVTDPRAYNEAVGFQYAAWKSAKDGGDALSNFKWATPFGELDGHQIRQMMFDEDLLGGFMSEWQAELRRLNEGRTVGRLRKGHEFLQKKNLALGGLVENNARIALYLDQMAKGVDPKQAAQAVRHFLFDYTPTGLSHFEQTKIRRLTSFYRWTKNNMLLSVEQLAKQPGKYAGIAKVKHAAEELTAEGSPTEEFLPEWLAEGYPVRIAGGEKPTYFSLQNWLPAMQIAELFEDIDEHHVPGLSWALGMMAPTIGIPLEQAMNQSLFFEDKIQKFPGERREFLGQQLPPRLVHLLRAARPLSEINRFTRAAHPGRAVHELFAGKTYPYDYQKEQRTAAWRKRERLGQLKSAWKRALLNKDVREAERLRQEYLATKKTVNVQ